MVRREIGLILAAFVLGLTRAASKVAIDLGDNDFYLPSRKGGPPSVVIEDIRRGQDSVLVKLQQVTTELENDELKLNNIFYKLGHHDTEIKSLSNGLGHLKSSGRKTESKLNKHAFNVEFLHRQLKDVQKQLKEKNDEHVKILALQKTVDHLEDRLSEVLVKLAAVLVVRQENTSRGRSLVKSNAIDGGLSEYVAKPTTLIHFPLRDQGACDENWRLYDETCFYVGVEKMTFREALSFCVSKGGHLLSLTKPKIEALRKILHSGKHYWTSATDVFSQNRWSFLITGELVPYSLWASSFKGFIHSSHANRHCGYYNVKGLQPANCGHRFHFICEKI